MRRAADLDKALAAADRAFKTWRKVSAFERYKIMRKAAEILRSRADSIAELMTIEQGKPLAQAKLETNNGADLIDWFAEEGRRAYGRIVPARADGVRQMVVRTPVGPVAAFTPWNFPINQAVRKISGALAAGCSIIVKGPEETPASCAELVRAFVDGGVPPGVINLVFGVPSEISEYLIPHPVIRKVSFTGSTAVGKRLSMLAGQHMKRITMELGGHAPALVFDDADRRDRGEAARRQQISQCRPDLRRADAHADSERRSMSLSSKSSSTPRGRSGLATGWRRRRRWGRSRICAAWRPWRALSPTRRRNGAKLRTGGKRMGNKGFFFEPTVLTDVPTSARIMNEEPFGPIAILNRFDDYDEAVAEANRLEYGLAAYAYTRSAKTIARLGEAVESGMVTINHLGLGLPEIPFGGIKDFGFRQRRRRRGARGVLQQQACHPLEAELRIGTRVLSTDSGCRRDHRERRHSRLMKARSARAFSAACRTELICYTSVVIEGKAHRSDAAYLAARPAISVDWFSAAAP